MRVSWNASYVSVAMTDPSLGVLRAAAGAAETSRKIRVVSDSSPFAGKSHTLLRRVSFPILETRNRVNDEVILQCLR